MNQPVRERLGVRAASTAVAVSAWSALSYPVFRYLRIATVISNVDSSMYVLGRVVSEWQQDPDGAGVAKELTR